MNGQQLNKFLGKNIRWRWLTHFPFLFLLRSWGNMCMNMLNPSGVWVRDVSYVCVRMCFVGVCQDAYVLPFDTAGRAGVMVT